MHSEDLKHVKDSLFAKCDQLKYLSFGIHAVHGDLTAFRCAVKIIRFNRLQKLDWKCKSLKSFKYHSKMINFLAGLTELETLSIFTVIGDPVLSFEKNKVPNATLKQLKVELVL